MIDKDTLLGWLGIFTERFNQPAMSPAVIREFAWGLGDLDTDEFVIGARHVFNVNRFFPSPQEILEAARPSDSVELVAAEALEDVMRWRGKGELADHVLSETISRAISAIGGISRLASATESDLPWIRKEFVAAYVSADRVEKSRERVGRALLKERQASLQLSSGSKQ
jgi:hypothetical protein